MVECTFQPKVSVIKPFALLEHQAASQSFQAPNSSALGTSQSKIVIKSYDKEIQRIRQANLQRSLVIEQEEKKARGDGYDKLRLQQVQGPQFT